MKSTFLLILSFISIINCYSQTAEDYIAKGKTKIELQNYQGAISDLNSAIEINPNSSIAYYYRGWANHDLDNYDEAIADYTKAIEINPNYADAYFNRGKVKIAIKDYNGAIDDFTKTIEIRPSLPLAYYKRGRVKEALGQKESGCLDFGKALELGDNSANEAIKQFCSTYPTTTETKANSDKVAKVYYKDGKTFQYYTHDGISITMVFETEREYGTYYVAYIAIENFTGGSFNFNPDDIKAFLTHDGITEKTKVYSNDEYIKKVNRKQKTSAFFYAWGQNYSASQAGYSQSSTTSSTSGYSNTNVSISGYYGNNYGSAIGTVNSYGSSTTNSNTISYNGAAQYAAQQNAANSIDNFNNRQYQIRNLLNQGYLKLNTIDNEERITGQINIQFKKAESVKIIVPVNGEQYEFSWESNKH